MDYSSLTAFHLSWLYMTVRLAARLLSNKSDIGAKRRLDGDRPSSLIPVCSADQLPACRRFVRHVVESDSGREQA